MNDESNPRLGFLLGQTTLCQNTMEINAYVFFRLILSKIPNMKVLKKKMLLFVQTFYIQIFTNGYLYNLGILY